MVEPVTGMKAFGFNEPHSSPGQVPANGKREVRCAVRFPLRMQVSITTSHGSVEALTRNVSASGVLFEMSELMPLGAEIEFTLKMPGEALGLQAEVHIDCRGRVMRSTREGAVYLTAATIDEYEFVS